MKINKMAKHNKPQFSERDNVAKSEKSNNLFSSTLNQASDEYFTERLNKLLDQITTQGEKLASTPTYSELRAYRDLVKNFLGEAVNRMYSLETKAGWDRQGRRKLFTTVKKVDSALADLAEDVKSQQTRQLSIMDKLDAIRGMLVDMYM